MNIYYIAYSQIEDSNAANQIQSKNTYENLKKVDPTITGIFLGNKGGVSNPFWPIRKKDGCYYIDRFGYINTFIEKITKIRIFRRDFFPYVFFQRCKKILSQDKNEKIIYIRTAGPVEILSYLKNLDRLNISKIIIEVHNLNFNVKNFYIYNFERKISRNNYEKMFNKIKSNSEKVKIVCLTNSLSKIIREKYNFQNNIDIIPDAHNFPVAEPKTIDFHKNKIEVIYTGLTFKNKGLGFLLQAIPFLNEKIVIRIIGGHILEREKIINKYKNYIKSQKLIIEEPVTNDIIKQKLLNADIAVIPLPEGGFSNFTSPLKLFEYMSLGLPIIASDLSVLREVLNEDCSVFCKPNSAKDMAEKINFLSNNEDLARSIGNSAFQKSKKHSYFERAKRIHSLLSE